jgi:transposase
MKKRVFSRNFKLEVLRELDSGKPAVEVCRERELNPTVLTRWKREFRQNPGQAFAGKGHTWKLEAKNAELERKIGQQTMEIDFLKKINTNLQAMLAEVKKNQR